MTSCASTLGYNLNSYCTKGAIQSGIRVQGAVLPIRSIIQRRNAHNDVVQSTTHGHSQEIFV
jgi:hypothetical protein